MFTSYFVAMHFMKAQNYLRTIKDALKYHKSYPHLPRLAVEVRLSWSSGGTPGELEAIRDAALGAGEERAAALESWLRLGSRRTALRRVGAPSSSSVEIWGFAESPKSLSAQWYMCAWSV